MHSTGLFSATDLSAKFDRQASAAEVRLGAAIRRQPGTGVGTQTTRGRLLVSWIVALGTRERPAPDGCHRASESLGS